MKLQGGNRQGEAHELMKRKQPERDRHKQIREARGDRPGRDRETTRASERSQAHKSVHERQSVINIATTRGH